MDIKICASILSANFLELGKELKRVENAGCNFIHVDVMDGNYVANMAVGLCVAKWLPLGTTLRLDAHLAIQNPINFVDAFADAGMNSIIFHPETYPHHYMIIDKIKSRNMLAGIALSPTSSIESIKYMLNDLDIIDQLAVNAGFPNQAYRTVVNQKLTELKRLKNEFGYGYELHVDGGINETTAKMAVDSGAEVLISGSTLFESKNMVSVVEKLRSYPLNQTQGAL